MSLDATHPYIRSKNHVVITRSMSKFLRGGSVQACGDMSVADGPSGSLGTGGKVHFDATNAADMSVTEGPSGSLGTGERVPFDVASASGSEVDLKETPMENLVNKEK